MFRNYPRETVETILDVRKSALPVIGFSLRYVCTCHARIPTCARAIHLATQQRTRVLCQIPPFSEISPFKIRQLLHCSLQSPTLYTVRLLLTALLSSPAIADLVYLDLPGH